MFFKLVKIITLLFFLLTQHTCNAYYFKKESLSGNKISLGDWTAPQLELIEQPASKNISSNLNLKIKITDDFGSIEKIEYRLYSGEFGTDDSDWVLKRKDNVCADNLCGEADKEINVLFDSAIIENSDHVLCQSGESGWCEGHYLPDGKYYILVNAYDDSLTVTEEGNKSDDLIYFFEKVSGKILCNLADIKAKAGESISFPDIVCPDYPGISNVYWDLNKKDGVDFQNPDLSGNSPLLSEGYLFPGTYEVTIKGVDQDDDCEIESIKVNVSNPDLDIESLIINEFLPNPYGIDTAMAPYGEWIELYNDLPTGINLLGFVFYDDFDDHDLVITSKNCDNNSTLIGPKEYKIIYRDGDPVFSLNNSGYERVRLFDDFLDNIPVLLDETSYELSTSEDESLARIPNLTGSFERRVPTKGFAN